MCQLKRSPGLLWQPRFGSRSERAVQGSGPSLLSASVQRGFARWLGSLESSVALLASSFQFGPSAIPARPEIPSPKKPYRCLPLRCLSLPLRKSRIEPQATACLWCVCVDRLLSARPDEWLSDVLPGQVSLGPSRPLWPACLGWASCRPACESIDSSGGG